MKKIEGFLHISAIVECPNEACGEMIDLFEIEDLTNDGFLYKELLSDNGFGNKDLNQEIQCPDCGEKFIVKDVIW